jgi:hypothetical protein
MPKEKLNSVVQPWQLLGSKTEREITPEIQVILVGYSNVAVLRFKIVRNFFLKWIQL